MVDAEAEMSEGYEEGGGGVEEGSAVEEAGDGEEAAAVEEEAGGGSEEAGAVEDAGGGEEMGAEEAPVEETAEGEELPADGEEMAVEAAAQEEGSEAGGEEVTEEELEVAAGEDRVEEEDAASEQEEEGAGQESAAVEESEGESWQEAVGEAPTERESIPSEAVRDARAQTFDEMLMTYKKEYKAAVSDALQMAAWAVKQQAFGKRYVSDKNLAELDGLYEQALSVIYEAGDQLPEWLHRFKIENSIADSYRESKEAVAPLWEATETIRENNHLEVRKKLSELMDDLQRELNKTVEVTIDHLVRDALAAANVSRDDKASFVNLVNKTADSYKDYVNHHLVQREMLQQQFGLPPSGAVGSRDIATEVLKSWASLIGQEGGTVSEREEAIEDAREEAHDIPGLIARASEELGFANNIRDDQDAIQMFGAPVAQ